ncbi:MAG: type IV secretory system conjugative DNA transfer family protein [Chloroflexota bacterium]|nr:type IV secretory system conjugative DNA transfer family protein [Chloroflexota bacterium]
MTNPAWGPRPGGPSVSLPAKPAARSSGCVNAIMALMLLVGLSSLQSTSPGLGLILLLVSGGYFFMLLSRPARERLQLLERQRRQDSEAERWRQSLPETVAVTAPDPQRVVHELTLSAGGGAFLGLTPDYREWIAAERQQAVLVLGPPRSGKTSSLIIPTVLAMSGPIVSTSTKGEVMQATAAARSRLGRVWLFDPSGTEPVPKGVLELHWSPIRSSRTWDGARAMADAMVGASSAGEGVENASYWTESAKTLLAPLLHAAALGGHTITDVRRWISRIWLEEAGRILDDAGAEAAADDLVAIAATEERERSSIFSTARIVLTAYGSDAAAARSQYQNFDADKFVRSADTVYITAPSHLQSILAPLVVGLLEEIRNATYDLARRQARGEEKLTQPVLWALDEIANIAPLKKFPSIVSEAGGQGLQIMASFQDLSQARARWGAAADGFLSLFGTKVVFPGIGDKKTLEALSTLVGDWDRPYTTFNTGTGQSTQVGVPMGVMLGTNSSTGLSYTSKREALLSAAEVANIPQGHALTVRAQRWGLVETTPFFRSAVWQAVLANAPHAIEDRGGADELTASCGNADLSLDYDRDALPLRRDPAELPEGHRK